MNLKIYIDVLFIVNLIADFLLIQATAFFIKQKVPLTKTFFASLLGALYASVAFFLPGGTGIYLPLTFGVSLFMLLCAFGKRKLRLFLKSVAVFYVISFVLAGIGMGISFLAPVNVFVKGGIFYADVNVYQLLAAFLICVPLVHIVIGFVRNIRIKSNFLYRITIEKDGKSITATALLDSGNFLKDPISQISILVAEWKAVSPLFPEENFLDCIAACAGEFSYIPLKTVNGTGGMFVFRPDRVVSDEISFPEPVYIGITENALDKDGAFSIILPNFVAPAQTERI